MLLYCRQAYASVNDHLICKIYRIMVAGPELKDRNQLQDGSVQNIPEIPQFIRNRYQTAWETKQKI